MSSLNYQPDKSLTLSYLNLSLSDSKKYDKYREAESSDKVISDQGLLISQWVLFALICQAMDIFGTVTNVINIICFIKQGFKDPVNVSFFGKTAVAHSYKCT